MAMCNVKEITQSYEPTENYHLSVFSSFGKSCFL